MAEARAAARPPAPLLLRERVVILGALAAIVLLSWLYLYLDRNAPPPGAMPGMAMGGMAMPGMAMGGMAMGGMAMGGMAMGGMAMGGMAMGGMAMGGMAMGGMAMGGSRPPGWTAAEFALQFVMWAVMMAGMMLPSAAPMILIFATVNRRRRAKGQVFVPTAIFAAGYLAAWGAFSLLAAAAQGGLERAALMAPMMPIASPLLGGIVVIAAGTYQFTPLKGLCLRQCRSPLAFVLAGWEDGRAGALRMGWRHGIYCLGCCWVLMALLFVAGVMNLLWVAALAAFVFVEKLFPAGEWVARASGALMLAFGIYLLTTV